MKTLLLLSILVAGLCQPLPALVYTPERPSEGEVSAYDSAVLHLLLLSTDHEERLPVFLKTLDRERLARCEEVLREMPESPARDKVLSKVRAEEGLRDGPVFEMVIEPADLLKAILAESDRQTRVAALEAFAATLDTPEKALLSLRGLEVSALSDDARAFLAPIAFEGYPHSAVLAAANITNPLRRDLVLADLGERWSRMSEGSLARFLSWADLTEQARRALTEGVPSAGPLSAD